MMLTRLLGSSLVPDESEFQNWILYMKFKSSKKGGLKKKKKNSKLYR